MPNPVNILRHRLLNQQLVRPEFSEPADIVSWMGVMQAQDYGWVRWALGVRMKTPSMAAVKRAFDNADIVRLHLNRMTWQMVNARDARPLIALYEKKNAGIVRSYAKGSGVDFTDDLYNRSEAMLREVLKGGNWKTKEELAELYAANDFPTQRHCIYIFLAMAEARGIICSGGMDGKACHYALLDERVPECDETSHDETLRLLARKYFQSHAPATMEDFVWWTGLNTGDCTRAVKLIADELATETINGKTYYLHKNCRQEKFRLDVCHLLPPYDEYLLGYKDRSHLIDEEYVSRAYNNYGLFHPVILHGGYIIGNWDAKTAQPSFFETYLPSEDVWRKAIQRYTKMFKI